MVPATMGDVNVCQGFRAKTVHLNCVQIVAPTTDTATRECAFVSLDGLEMIALKAHAPTTALLVECACVVNASVTSGGPRVTALWIPVPTIAH